jgi:hypothetical protein
MDAIFTDNIPSYSQFIRPVKRELWSQPESGLLAGKVVSIKSKNEIVIEDLNGKLWVIKTDSLSVKSRIVARMGKIIKIIGDKTGDNTFTANEFRAWKVGPLRQILTNLERKIQNRRINL